MYIVHNENEAVMLNLYRPDITNYITDITNYIIMNIMEFRRSYNLDKKIKLFISASYKYCHE